MNTTRRGFLKTSAAVGAGLAIPGFYRIGGVHAAALPASVPLSDPALQPKFVTPAPNALSKSFIYRSKSKRVPRFIVQAKEAYHDAGLLKPDGSPAATRIYGYGAPGETPTWPGKTFEVEAVSAGGKKQTRVKWLNNIGDRHYPLPLDQNLHWCYSLHDYTQYSIKNAGVPMIPHLHGGHSDFQFDGNPEFFFSPTGVLGPQWANVPGGFPRWFRYDNDVRAGTLWYHDHALGITRLNVYAGLAGFYIVRDEFDTGRYDNSLGLPANGSRGEYELAYAIQDRMFTEDGQLFLPAFPEDPSYEDFITGEGAVLPPELFPGGGPTALAEFFGDHMVVNGKIWPKANVEPRHYRMRLLNGSDSRFLVIRFRAAAAPEATTLVGASDPIPFFVIGSDQGLASRAMRTDTLVFEPGGRYDIVFNFGRRALANQRIIMQNIGGDAPFGGDFGEAVATEDLFTDRQTDRIMAFDVNQPLNLDVPDLFNRTDFNHLARYNGFGPPALGEATNVRRVALFEGKDEFGRLQPLLGTVHPRQPNDAGSQATPYTWSNPTTETPALGATEIWDIYNFTEDAHPVHLHLVNFEILRRKEITFTGGDDNGFQEVLMHNGDLGIAPIIKDLSVGNRVRLGKAEGYVENAPKDMVTALPGQVTRIKAYFDKPGRYVWHCHILSHEDHEMMRVLQVGVAPV